MKKPANPPAFPMQEQMQQSGPDGSWLSPGQPGMELRDYFAGKAMESMLRDTVADEAFETYQQLAADAYRMADAMLAERERAS